MRIGLLRHFPVEQSLPSGWRTAADLQLWREQYDASRAILGPANLGGYEWDQCLTSDLARAVATATAVFQGPLEKTALLREPELAQFRTGKLRLPVWIWRWLLRLAWMTGHGSQRAGRDEFRRRVTDVADLLEARSGNILVVSHAGMMAYLSAELRRRGFIGPKLRIAKHATLYVYSRS
jgi:broad specificity phosphatase PhoE